MTIRALEDTSTSRLDDKALLKTFLSMDQPKMTLEDKTVNKILTIHLDMDRADQFVQSHQRWEPVLERKTDVRFSCNFAMHVASDYE
jgi:hypothetical protein